MPLKRTKVLKVTSEAIASLAQVTMRMVWRDTQTGKLVRDDLGSVMNYIRWRRRSGSCYCPYCGEELFVGRKH